MPSVPRAGFIVIEAKLVLRGLEAVLDCPAMSLDKDESLDVCSRWTPGREEGEIAITDVVLIPRQAALSFRNDAAPLFRSLVAP
jgi:hypothetical protein